MVHAVAQRAGLSHGSSGEGIGVRRLWLRGSLVSGWRMCSVDPTGDSAADDESEWTAIDNGNRLEMLHAPEEQQPASGIILPDEHAIASTPVETVLGASPATAPPVALTQVPLDHVAITPPPSPDVSFPK